MKHLIMQSFPAFCYFLSLTTKYSSQHPVPEHPHMSLTDSYFMPVLTNLLDEFSMRIFNKHHKQCKQYKGS